MTPQSHTTPSSPNEEAIKAQAAVTFRGLGIDEKVLAVLDKANFTTPTPIQHKVIPTAIEGKDIIGIAQTGTGKTLLAQMRGCLFGDKEIALMVL